MTTQILTRFALTAATTLAATAVLTMSETAHAASVTKNGSYYDYNGTSYTLSTVTGTYSTLATTLQATPWWGDASLAAAFATAAGESFGVTQYYGGGFPGVYGGPGFAYAAPPVPSGPGPHPPPMGPGLSSYIPSMGTAYSATSPDSQRIYATATATPVPTPALLPGLVGMGIAAYRKHKLASSTEA